ncbi:SDR family oxidoreductase [Humibacter antri]
MAFRVAIAGASRGLGLALARSFSDRGAEVWAGCRHPEDIGLEGHVRYLDVTDEASIQDFAAGTAEAGGVDVLINAAGVDARAFGAASDQRGPFDLSATHFLAEVEVNAVGPMLTIRAFREQLIASGRGRIVNLSSRTGSMVVGADLCWDIGYNASKAALNAVTVRTATLLRSYGVIVVAVHPGWVRTNMGGPEAATAPEEAAGQLCHLIENLSPEQSGQFLQPDGSPHPW